MIYDFSPLMFVIGLKMQHPAVYIKDGFQFIF